MKKKKTKKSIEVKKEVFNKKGNDFWFRSPKQSKKEFWIVACITAVLFIFVVAYGLLITKGAGEVFTQDNSSGGWATMSDNVAKLANGDGTNWSQYSSTNNINAGANGLQLTNTLNAWANGGVSVSDSSNPNSENLKSKVALINSSEDMVVAWISGNDHKPYAQRIDSNGAIDVNWNPNPPSKIADVGVFNGQNQLSVVPSDSESSIYFFNGSIDNGATNDVNAAKKDGHGQAVWGINNYSNDGNVSDLLGAISDGNDGAIFAWSEGPNVYVQRIDKDGNSLWNSGSPVLAAIDYNKDLQIVTNGDHGVYLSWVTEPNKDVKVNKINNDGSGGGPGLTIDGGINDLNSMIADGVGGLVMAWQKNNDIYAQAITGSPSFPWDSGQSLPDNTPIVLANTVNEENTPELILGDSSNVIAIWRMANIPQQRSEIWGQKIALSDGSFSWGADGKRLAYGGITANFDIAQDNSGGAFIIWEAGAINGTRIDSSGNIMTGWSSAGTGNVLESISPGIDLTIKNIDTGSTPTYVWWNSGQILAQKIDVGGFYTTGYLISSVIDAGPSNNWNGNNFSWDTDMPSGVSFQTRTATGDPITNFSIGGTPTTANQTCMIIDCHTDGSITNINDGDPLTAWIDDYNAPYLEVLPQSAAIEFTSDQNISAVIIKTPNNLGGGTGYIRPATYEIDAWNSAGSSWVPVNNPVDTSWTLDATTNAWEKTVTFASINTSKIQITVNTVDKSNVVFPDVAVISELEAYAGSWSDPGFTTVSSNGSAISSPAGRYLQYKVSLTGNGSSTPTVTSVRLGDFPAPPAPPTPAPTYTPSPQPVSNPVQQPTTPTPTPATEPTLESLQQTIEDLQKTVADLEQRIAKLESGTFQTPQPISNPQPVISPTPATNYYTVIRGDTLRAIATKVYNNSALYTKLIDLNKSEYPSLATNPNAIEIGWLLTY